MHVAKLAGIFLVTASTTALFAAPFSSSTMLSAFAGSCEGPGDLPNWDRVTALIGQVSPDQSCPSLRRNLALVEEAVSLFRCEGKGPAGGWVGYTTYKEWIVELRKKIALNCEGKAEKPRQKSACQIPPPGHVEQDGADIKCIVAKNPNPDERCLYSFTYMLSRSGQQPKRQHGRAAAGEKTRICHQGYPELAFEKWTLTTSGAR